MSIHSSKKKKVQKKVAQKPRKKSKKCKFNKSCEEQVLGCTGLCLRHWSDTIRYRKNKANPYTFEPSELWQEQDGKCAITGKILIVGIDASLDHIIPTSKGGSNNKDNLRFVHLAINGFKNSYTDEEFKEIILEICPKLIEWAQNKANDAVNKQKSISTNLEEIKE